MASAQTVGKVLAEIVLCGFPNFSPTKEMTQVWFLYLQDIDDDLLIAGLRHHIATSGSAFAPSIPEIRAACAGIKARISGLPSAFEAWEDLLKAGNGIRVYVNDENEIVREEYPFKHPLIKTVATQLGWPKTFIGDNVMADRAHFFKAWDAAASKYLDEQAELPQVGKFISEQSNLLPAVNAVAQLTERMAK
jgi:hypothetical protein